MQDQTNQGTECRTTSVEAAGRALGIGRQAAYEAVRRGDIPAIRLGRSWRVPLAALDRLAPPRSVQ